MKDTTVERVLERTFQHLEKVVKEKKDTCSERTGQRPARPKPGQDGSRHRKSDRIPRS